MTTLREILEKTRAAKQRLPPNEAAVVFAAVVRLAAAQKATVRARLVQIDDAGGLHLAPLDERIAETEPGYQAPELVAAGAPRKNEPRVQVYAAGALGYELLTGHTPPQPGGVPGAELAGPLGDVVRMALAPDRRERFGDLAQLQQAVEGVQPRPPAEGERNILAALRTRLSRPPPEKEAVARIIDRLHQLEAQTAALGKTQSRLEAALRQVQETVERFEDGQRRASELQRRRGSSIAPGLASGAVAALAVLAVAWALGMVAAPGALRPAPSAATAPSAALPAPPPEPPIPAKETAKESPKQGLKELARDVARPPPKEPAKETPPPAGEPADASAMGEADAGAEDASALAEAADAGDEAADASVAAAEDAGTPAKVAPAPAPAPAPEKKRRPAQNNQAAMQHALAISELRHAETALEQGQTDEAVESFRSALESEPAMAAAFRGLGTAYSMQGKNAEALQAYEKYLKLAPKAPDAGDIRTTVKQLRAKTRGG
ncbi:MAG TPA: tetratricopeptide repeat-containing protein kinase family protein [Myxococcales bacterium]